MDDKLLRRAGLDYHEYAAVRRHASLAGLAGATRGPTRRAASPSRTRGERDCARRCAWQPGDWLVFGSETRRPAAELLRDAFAPAQRAAPADACRPAQPEPEQRGGGGGVRGLAAERLRRRRLTSGFSAASASRDISCRIACAGSMRPSSTATTACVIGISHAERRRARQHRRRAVDAFGHMAELLQDVAAAPGPAPAAGPTGGCATGRRWRSAPDRPARTGP